jgi:hypothetical protein
LFYHGTVPELSQEGSFICVLGISNLHIYTIFLLNVGTVPTVWYIFFSFYYRLWKKTSFGRMESFIFLYIWNQICSVQYPVLHNYYTAWFSLVRILFFSQVWQNYLFVRTFKSEIFKKKIWINLKSTPSDITVCIQNTYFPQTLSIDIFQGGVLFKFIHIFFLNISDLNVRTNK